MSYETISDLILSNANLDKEDGLLYDKELYVAAAKERDITEATLVQVHDFHKDFMTGSTDGFGRMAVEAGLEEATATFEFPGGCIEHHFQKEVEIAGEEHLNYVTTMSTLDFGADSNMSKVQTDLAALVSGVVEEETMEA